MSSAGLRDTTPLLRASAVLNEGGIIAYPTEAVFGLGCDPHNEAALMRLLAIKERPISKGLILVASDVDQLKSYLAPVEAYQWQAVLQTWPGPVTWVFPSRPSVSPTLRGAHSTIAVRVSAHPIVQRLCETFGGAIVSTSANKNEQAPARTHQQVREIFGSEIDFILEEDVGGQQNPTQIRDVKTGAVLRAG